MYHRRVQDLDDIGVLETAVRLYLSHSRLDALLPGGDEDLFESASTAGRCVGDEVDERESAFSEKFFNLVGPAVYLERRVAAWSGRAQVARETTCGLQIHCICQLE